MLETILRDRWGSECTQKLLCSFNGVCSRTRNWTRIRGITMMPGIPVRFHGREQYNDGTCTPVKPCPNCPVGSRQIPVEYVRMGDTLVHSFLVQTERPSAGHSLFS
eukprot:gene4802-biopygen12807